MNKKTFARIFQIVAGIVIAILVCSLLYQQQITDISQELDTKKTEIQQKSQENSKIQEELNKNESILKQKDQELQRLKDENSQLSSLGSQSTTELQQELIDLKKRVKQQEQKLEQQQKDNNNNSTQTQISTTTVKSINERINYQVNTQKQILNKKIFVVIGDDISETELFNQGICENQVKQESVSANYLSNTCKTSENTEISLIGLTSPNNKSLNTDLQNTIKLIKRDHFNGLVILIDYEKENQEQIINSYMELLNNQFDNKIGKSTLIIVKNLFKIQDEQERNQVIKQLKKITQKAGIKQIITDYEIPPNYTEYDIEEGQKLRQQYELFVALNQFTVTSFLNDIYVQPQAISHHEYIQQYASYYYDSFGNTKKECRKFYQKVGTHLARSMILSSIACVSNVSFLAPFILQFHAGQIFSEIVASLEFNPPIDCGVKTYDEIYEIMSESCDLESYQSEEQTQACKFSQMKSKVQDSKWWKIFM